MKKREQPTDRRDTGPAVADATVSDEQLVERFQSSRTGDPGAFDTLIRRHQHQVRARCRQLTRADADVDDLAQEVFLKAYLSLARFEARSTFRTWLHTITTRHCLDFLRKRRVRLFVDLDDVSKHTVPELTVPPAALDILCSKANRRLVGSVMSRLPGALKQPLLLRECDGLAYRRIADECGVTLGAVKMRLMRARRQVRQLAAIVAGKSHSSTPQA